MESRQRAALALVALGPERAARMLKRLPQDEAIILSDEVARIGKIDANTARDVLAELAGSLKKSTTVATGGPDYAQEILSRAFGEEVAASRRNLTKRGNRRHFDYIENGRATEVVRMLDTEPRPVIALVLAHLHPAKSADILARFDSELRADIGLRLAQLRTIPSNVVDMVDDDLRVRLAALLTQQVSTFNGVQLLAELLNNGDQEMERELLSDMMTLDPGLTEQLRDALFVFDDVGRLGDRAIQEILKASDTRVLATAMKNADPTVTDRIFKNLSERARENLREEIEFLRGLRPADIREARKRIVGIVRQLEEAGAIVIERAGGDGAI